MQMPLDLDTPPPPSAPPTTDQRERLYAAAALTVRLAEMTVGERDMEREDSGVGSERYRVLWIQSREAIAKAIAAWLPHAAAEGVEQGERDRFVADMKAIGDEHPPTRAVFV